MPSYTFSAEQARKNFEIGKGGMWFEKEKAEMLLSGLYREIEIASKKGCNQYQLSDRVIAHFCQSVRGVTEARAWFQQQLEGQGYRVICMDDCLIIDWA